MSDSMLTGLIQAAANNPTIRAGLLKNPREALAKAGINVPATVEVTASDSGTWGVHITVGQAGAVELSEEFLEGTSGGAGCAFP